MTSPLVPTARIFFDHLVVALGRLTDYTPNNCVYFASVVTETLREAGYDPESLPGGWSRDERCADGGPSVDRRIQFAFRNQREKYCGNQTPLTVLGGGSGMWGLTPAGVLRAQKLETERRPTPHVPFVAPVVVETSTTETEEPSDGTIKTERRRKVVSDLTTGVRPTASYFYDTVITTLASLTDYTAGSSVDHTECSYAVLSSLGLDPKALPAGWELDGRNGVMRRIHFAWRNQQMRFTDKGAKKGQWTLTEEGVERARFLTGVFAPLAQDLLDPSPTYQPTPQDALKTPDQGLLEDFEAVFEGIVGDDDFSDVEDDSSEEVPTSTGPNATSRWIAAKGVILIEALSNAIAKKMPASAQMGLVEDHVNNYLLKLISRDGLRKHIESGESLPISKLASWAVRSSYTDIRGWGKDASCREIRGARTEQNRRAIAKGERDWTHEWMPSATSQTILTEGANGQVSLTDVVDTSDTMSEAEARMDFDRNVWSQVENILREDFPTESDRYLRVTRMMMEGFKPKDIAKHEHVSRSRASILVSDVRRVLRGAVGEGFLSMAE